MINNKNNKGFTLVEIIVVIAILGILVTVAIAMLNPVSQINKARDAKKQSDLEQIKSAMDLYYDDNNCYPTSFNLFGSSWTSDRGTVYMAKVPQSPDNLYRYLTDTNSNCPQWYSIWVRLSQAPPSGSVVSKSTCPLFAISDPICHPQDDSGDHICVSGGIINCASLSSQSIGD